MKHQFTKGPWEVQPTPETLEGGDFQARIIARGALSDGNDAIVVGHYSNRNGIGNIHWPYDAYLIASAPELYGVCRDIAALDNTLFASSIDPHQHEIWDALVERCKLTLLKIRVPEEFGLTTPADNLPDLPESVSVADIGIKKTAQ